MEVEKILFSSIDKSEGRHNIRERNYIGSRVVQELKRTEVNKMSLVKPYLVVESDIPEAVGNYGAIVDSINKNHDFSAKLNEQSENLNDAFYSTLIESVIELKNISNKDFEATLNLVFYLLAEPFFRDSEEETVGDDFQHKFSERFQSLLAKIFEISPESNPVFNDKTSLKFTSVLSILTVFFNLLINTSSLRIDILKTIVKIFTKLDQTSLEENVNFLKPILKKSTADNTKFIFEKYLADAGASEAEIVSFTNTLANLVALEYPNESLTILKAVALKYQTAVDVNVIKSLLAKALANVRELDLSYFNNFDLSSLKSSDITLFELLNLYTLSTNNFTQFVSYLTENKDTIEKTAGARISTLITKKEFLIVANLALKASESNSYEFSEENKGISQSVSNIAPVITYKQISDALGHNHDLIKIESVLINAIKLNVIQGKIDQIKQIFSIYKINLIIVHDEKSGSNENKLGTKEWKFILKNLKQWKNSVNESVEIVQLQKKKISAN